MTQDTVERLARDLAETPAPDPAARERIRARFHELQTGGASPERSETAAPHRLAWRAAAAVFVAVVVAGATISIIEVNRQRPSPAVHATSTTAKTPIGATTLPPSLAPTSLRGAEDFLRTAFEDSFLGYVDIASISYVQSTIGVALTRAAIDHMFPPLESTGLPHAPGRTPVWIFLTTGTFQQGTASPCSAPFTGTCGAPFSTVTLAVVGGPVGGLGGPLFGNPVDLTGLGALHAVPPAIWQGYDHDAKPWIIPGMPRGCSGSAYSADFEQQPSSLLACPASGPVGTVVTLTGTGCSNPGAPVQLYYLGPTDYRGSEGGGVTFGVHEEGGGRWRATFTIPATVPEGGMLVPRSVPVTPGPTYFAPGPAGLGCGAEFRVTAAAHR